MREGTQQKVEKAKEMVEGGMTIKQAIKKVGISSATWHRYRDKNPSRHITVPIEPKRSGKLAAVIGDPSDVARFLEEYSG